MPTSNVIVSRTGTGWTVDVTACNLLADTLIKDFVVLHNSIVTSVTPYTKTTSTTLTYIGSALPSSTTVEIRRKTPTAVIQPVTYGQKTSSALWNSELDRTVRWKEEVDINGAGNVISVPVPQNDAYGSIWATDTVYPPTRKSVYDYVNTLAPINAPTLINPVVGTQTTSDNSTKAASTAYVQSNLANYATSALLTSSLVPYALISSPTFTGDPKSVTPSWGDNDTSIATTAFVNTNFTPKVRASRVTSVSISNNTSTTVVFSTKTIDTDSAYNTSTGEFIVPVGRGGEYLINSTVYLCSTTSGAGNVTALQDLHVNGSFRQRYNEAGVTNVNSFNVAFNFSDVITLAAGDIVKIVVNMAHSGAGAAITIGNNIVPSKFNITRQP